MSRGFVKEDDQEEAPFVPPRAALPLGATNYVTPNGMRWLLDEKEHLEKERATLPKDNETERRRAAAVMDGKLRLLEERIASARILKPQDQPKNEVRFGARVSFKNLSNSILQDFQIVGVDEADLKQKKIAFVAPIAKALIGKKVGEEAELKLGGEVRKLEIVEIEYP